MSPRPDRPTSAARDRGKRLVAASADRMASTLRGRTKPLVYAGTALAVAGVGSTISGGTASAATTPRAASNALASHAADGHALASHAADGHALSGHAPGGALVSRVPGGHAPASHGSASVSVAALPSIAALTSARHGLPLTPALTPAALTAARQAPGEPRVDTWIQVRDAINQQTNPVAARHGQLPPADVLTPVGISSTQSWMPISAAQFSNATSIVKQALNKKMGIRSAVIAVATAMQESRLFNLHYGDMDSLGLFQQRPSMGWGTAAQITDPSFAASAFLTALQQHQAGDPGWATQPLWLNAQAVQKSGVPFAYAKWEAQAAGLVKQIAMQLR